MRRTISDRAGVQLMTRGEEGFALVEGIIATFVVIMAFFAIGSVFDYVNKYMAKNEAAGEVDSFDAALGELLRNPYSCTTALVGSPVGADIPSLKTQLQPFAASGTTIGNSAVVSRIRLMGAATWGSEVVTNPANGMVELQTRPTDLRFARLRVFLNDPSGNPMKSLDHWVNFRVDGAGLVQECFDDENLDESDCHALNGIYDESQPHKCQPKSVVISQDPNFPDNFVGEGMIGVDRDVFSNGPILVETTRPSFIAGGLEVNGLGVLNAPISQGLRMNGPMQLNNNAPTPGKVLAAVDDEGTALWQSPVLRNHTGCNWYSAPARCPNGRVARGFQPGRVRCCEPSVTFQ